MAHRLRARRVLKWFGAAATVGMLFLGITSIWFYVSVGTKDGGLVFGAGELGFIWGERVPSSDFAREEYGLSWQLAPYVIRTPNWSRSGVWAARSRVIADRIRSRSSSSLNVSSVRRSASSSTRARR